MSKVKDFFEKNIKFLKAALRTARATNYSKPAKLLVLLDVLYCAARYHVRCKEYQIYRFYLYRHNYRKNFLLTYHQTHKYRKINTKHFTRSKYEMYNRVPDCYGREVLLAPACGEAAFLEFVKKHQKVVIKPDVGSCGREVSKLEYSNDASVLEFFRGLTEDVLCEEFIRQHDAMNAMCPFSVNTIRIQTLLDDDKVEVVSANLRTTGSKDSIADNMRQCGIGAQIDLETGIISTFGHDYQGYRYSHHPLSGTQIIGFQIPNWEKVLDLVQQLHHRLPQCKLYGWDVAITADGAILVEANNRPGPMITQLMDLQPKGEHILKVIKAEEKKSRWKKRRK